VRVRKSGCVVPLAFLELVLGSQHLDGLNAQTAEILPV
jgi:hypothetical protein